jgi:hypothetical protein
MFNFDFIGGVLDQLNIGYDFLGFFLLIFLWVFSVMADYSIIWFEFQLFWVLWWMLYWAFGCFDLLFLAD